jgi:2-amino-4-hydroxy-6-hydroxymethyldihydropteridine diphosphokinase
VALGLGSNVGNLEDNLRSAIRDLERSLESLVVAPPYRSQPVSFSAQDSYLNTALTGRTRLAADELLALTKALEREAGRRPGPRFGPRPLDIDLLIYGEHVLHTPELCVPHPRLRERRFYLAPLADIAPHLRVPPDGVSVGELLKNLDDPHRVERVSWSRPPSTGS